MHLQHVDADMRWSLLAGEEGEYRIGYMTLNSKDGELYQAPAAASTAGDPLAPTASTVSDVKSVAVGEASPKIRIMDIEMDEWPSVVFFFIPGNPGVLAAYWLWARSLLKQLHSERITGLVIFSSHLGHLTHPKDPTRMRTCKDNIKHQTTQIGRLLEDLERNVLHRGYKFPSLVLSGHSAGGFMITNAAYRHKGTIAEVQKAIPAAINNIRILIFCGTICKFDTTGHYWGMLLSRRFDSVIKAVESDWIKNRIRAAAESNKIFLAILEEVTPNFGRQASLLCADEMIHLPKTETGQLDLLDEVNVKKFFLFSAMDHYVGRRTQANIAERYGPECVFIGEDWIHAFGLNDQVCKHAVSLSAAIAVRGQIPKKDQAISYHHKFGITTLKNNLTVFGRLFAVIGVMTAISFKRSFTSESTDITDAEGRRTFSSRLLAPSSENAMPIT